jgi:glycosyltransferase involved in cell wall biosynthesis
MPDIVFFSNHFARKSGTGITRYAWGLVGGIANQISPYKVIPVATWSDRKKEDLKSLKEKTGLRLLCTGRRLTPFLWMTVGLPKLEQLLDFPVSLVHINDVSYPIATAKPYVVTIHDIGPLTHPEYFNNDSFRLTIRGLEHGIKKASAFVCVSQVTADSLKDYVQTHYAVDLSDRTFVTYEGVSDYFFTPSDDSAFDQEPALEFLKQPFILAVGKISPRKNLEIVINALARIQSKITHHLVTVGGDGWDFENVKTLVNSLGLGDRVHFLGYVNDEMLHALYCKAALFIYPSLFEGFGLPVLEAMASGCPVVTSNVSSLPEVAGDAAVLVDPKSADDIASAIESVCLNRSLADELRRKGNERAHQFSWQRCAWETVRVYEELIS